MWKLKRKNRLLLHFNVNFLFISFATDYAYLIYVIKHLQYFNIQLMLNYWFLTIDSYPMLFEFLSRFGCHGSCEILRFRSFLNATRVILTKGCCFSDRKIWRVFFKGKTALELHYSSFYEKFNLVSIKFQFNQQFLWIFWSNLSSKLSSINNFSEKTIHTSCLPFFV